MESEYSSVSSRKNIKVVKIPTKNEESKEKVIEITVRGVNLIEGLADL